MSLWDSTKKAAWSKVQLFAVVACYLPPFPKEGDREAFWKKEDELKRKLDAQGGGFTEDDTPLLGITKAITNKAGKPDTVVCLLSGRAAHGAASMLGCAVPVYPLPPEALQALESVGLFDHIKGRIKDKIAAGLLLVAKGYGTAAELLGDPADPIDSDPPTPATEGANDDAQG